MIAHLGKGEEGRRSREEREGIISGFRVDVNEIALINLGLRERQRKREGGREKPSAFRLLIWERRLTSI